jgi:hypothetical protein
MTPLERTNPALQKLGALIGEWTVEIVFPGETGKVVQGKTRFEWAEGGAFLAMRSMPEPGGPPQSISLIGRDETSGAYRMLYFDERGVSRVYDMSFEANVLKMWRSAPRFSQRFEAKLIGDGVIAGSWEKCLDGLNWEHDFALTYRRIG